MCITCADRSAPNPKMCGKAKAERDKQALRIVEAIGKGKMYRLVAEEEGIAVATVHKLYKVGMKLMAPPSAKMQISVLLLQLEQNYSDIRDALDSTTDPTELAKLFGAANDNIARRQSLLGADTVNIRSKSKIKADMKDLVIKFDEDQNVRDTARARARKTGQI